MDARAGGSEGAERAGGHVRRARVRVERGSAESRRQSGPPTASATVCYAPHASSIPGDAHPCPRRRPAATVVMATCPGRLARLRSHVVGPDAGPAVSTKGFL